MTLRTFVGTIASAASALTVFTYVVALAFSVTLLFSTTIGQDLLRSQASLVIGAYFYETRVPLQINALAGYLATLLIYVACFSLAIRNDGGLIAGLRKLSGRITSQQPPNWFSVMPLVSSALLLLVVVISAIQNSVGLPTGSLPKVDPYKMLYGLAYAPVVEEIAYRISPIGTLIVARSLWHSYLTAPPRSELTLSQILKAFRRIPTSIKSLTLGRILRSVRNVPRAVKTEFARIRKVVVFAIIGLVFPERAKKEVGLPSFNRDRWQGIHWSEWTLLVVTSIFFGLAHLLANSGWQVGKVVSAALQGFVIGMAYLAYGAYASILFHWYFNVYFYVLSLGPVLVADAVSVLILATGILGLALIVPWLGKHIRKTASPNPTNGLYPSGQSSVLIEA